MSIWSNLGHETKSSHEPKIRKVWPMVYILYIGINLAIIMKQYGANASNNPYLIIENRNSNNLIIYPIYNIYPLF